MSHRHYNQSESEHEAIGDLMGAEKSHFRLCHFCFFLNESPLVVSRCGRCNKSLRNPGDAEEFYQQIAQIVESQMELGEEEEEHIRLLNRQESNFDEEDDEEMQSLDRQAVIEEMLPLNGLSVVW